MRNGRGRPALTRSRCPQGRRLRTATAAGAISIVAAVIATTTPVLAVAGVGVASVRWGGTPVTLTEVDAPDLRGSDHLTLVGKAVAFVTADPRLACLNGEELSVYATEESDTLWFSTADDPAACVLATFQPVVNLPEDVSPAPDLLCLSQQCVTEQASFRAGQATQAAFYNAGAAVAQAQSAPTVASGTANAAIALSTPELLAGTLIAQVDSVTELYAMEFQTSLTNAEASMRVDLAGQRVTVASPLRIDPSNALGCLLDGCPVVTYTVTGGGAGVSSTGGGNVIDSLPTSGQDPSIDPAKFVYWTGVNPYWENKDTSKGVYGGSTFNVWRLSKQVSNSNDFYATTQSSSVTPEHKSRLTKLETMMKANADGFRVVEASPLSVNQGGQGETVTYSATLQGNVSAKRDGTGGEVGGSFGVARQYTKPLHNHGGGMDGPLAHYAHWSTADNGSGYAKEVAAVTTWTLPINYTARWGWWQWAWWCNNPCGP